MSQVRSGGIKAGYSQNGGSYYIILSSINSTGQLLTYSGNSGSGGSATVGTFSNFSDTVNWSSLVTAGRLLKDCGRTVVSAGRTFKKFQAVQQANSVSTFGVMGRATGVANSADSGYLTGYIETNFDGQGQNGTATTTVLIARYS